MANLVLVLTLLASGWKAEVEAGESGSLSRDMETADMLRLKSRAILCSLKATTSGITRRDRTTVQDGRGAATIVRTKQHLSQWSAAEISTCHACWMTSAF